MTNEEYFEYMDRPLSHNEKQMLLDDGWSFLNEEYIYRDDYDGSFAHGIRQIRRVLLHLQYLTVYVKHSGKCKDVLEEVNKCQ